MLDSINLSAADQQLLAPLKGKNIYETTRDFIINRQFRRDFFIKGPLPLSPAQKNQAIDNLAFILMAPASEVKYTMGTRLGEARLMESIYRPIVELMADLKVRTFAEILAEVNKDKVTIARQNLLEALLTLSNNGTISPAIKPEQVDPAIAERCHQLNHALVEQNELPQLRFLASPVLQGAFSLNDIVRVMLQFKLKEPEISRDDLAQKLFGLILGPGKTLNKDGKQITDRKEQEDILNGQIDTFLNHTLPLIKAIGAI